MADMFEMKPISRDAIPAALEKAMRYRLLNEPGEAESICHDILRIDPENQEALVVLLLAQTDRFTKGYAVGATEVRAVLRRLRDPFEQAYYAGIIAEREAKAVLQRNQPGCGAEAYELLRVAMEHFEKAEAVRPPGNEDALLRWNACARIIMGNRLEPRVDERLDLPLE
jgi:hypothetical protein